MTASWHRVGVSSLSFRGYHLGFLGASSSVWPAPRLLEVPLYVKTRWLVVGYPFVATPDRPVPLLPGSSRHPSVVGAHAHTRSTASGEELSAFGEIVPLRVVQRRLFHLCDSRDGFG